MFYFNKLQTPKLATGIFHTTYTYLNTILDGDQPLVVTSQHTVTNTITAPDDYLSLLQPSEPATTVFETNTYYNTMSLTKTLTESDLTKVISTTDVVRQVVITESLPSKSTSVMTSYIAVDLDGVLHTGSNGEIIATPILSTTDVVKTYYVTYTYFNTYLVNGSTIVRTNVSTSSDIMTEKLYVLPTKKATLPQKLSTDSKNDILSLVDTDSNELDGSLKENINIYATKTYMTTYTYFTTLFQGPSSYGGSSDKPDQKVLSTNVNSHTRVIENVVTELIPMKSLPSSALKKLKMTLFGNGTITPVSNGRYTTVATLIDGQALEITAVKSPIKPSSEVKGPNLKTTTIEPSNEDHLQNSDEETEPDDNDVEGEYTNDNESEESILVEQNQNIKNKNDKKRKPVSNDLDASESGISPSEQTVNGNQIVSNIRNSTKIIRPGTASSPVSNLIGSLNFNGLKALGPMFNAMAGLINTNFGLNWRNDSNNNHIQEQQLPLIHISPRPITLAVKDAEQSTKLAEAKNKEKYPVDNQILSDQIQTPAINNVEPAKGQSRNPIYIPVSELKDNYEGAASQNVDHTVNAFPSQIGIKNEKGSALPLGKQSGTNKLPLLNGGIPISPGEIITANSDVILGRPTGNRPRIPLNSNALNEKPPSFESNAPIGMQPPVPPLSAVLAQDLLADSHSVQSLHSETYIGPPPPPQSVKHQPIVPNSSNLVNKIPVYHGKQTYINKHPQGQKVNAEISPNFNRLRQHHHIKNTDRYPLPRPHVIPIRHAPLPPHKPIPTDPIQGLIQNPLDLPIHQQVVQNIAGGNNDIIEIQRIPEVFSTDLPPVHIYNSPQIMSSVAAVDIIDASPAVETYSTYSMYTHHDIQTKSQLPEIVETTTGQPLLVNIQPSQVANVVIPHGSTSALIFGGVQEAHKSGEYFDDPSPYPDDEKVSINSGHVNIHGSSEEIASGEQIVHASGDSNLSGSNGNLVYIKTHAPIFSNQKINVDSHILNQDVDIHVPPIIFKEQKNNLENLPLSPTQTPLQIVTQQQHETNIRPQLIHVEEHQNGQSVQNPFFQAGHNVEVPQAVNVQQLPQNIKIQQLLQHINVPQSTQNLNNQHSVHGNQYLPNNIQHSLYNGNVNIQHPSHNVRIQHSQHNFNIQSYNGNTQHPSQNVNLQHPHYNTNNQHLSHNINVQLPQHVHVQRPAHIPYHPMVQHPKHIPVPHTPHLNKQNLPHLPTHPQVIVQHPHPQHGAHNNFVNLPSHHGAVNNYIDNPNYNRPILTHPEQYKNNVNYDVLPLEPPTASPLGNNNIILSNEKPETSWQNKLPFNVDIEGINEAMSKEMEKENANSSANHQIDTNVDPIEHSQAPSINDQILDEHKEDDYENEQGEVIQESNSVPQLISNSQVIPDVKLNKIPSYTKASETTANRHKPLFTQTETNNIWVKDANIVETTTAYATTEASININAQQAVSSTKESTSSQNQNRPSQNPYLQIPPAVINDLSSPSRYRNQLSLPTIHSNRAPSAVRINNLSHYGHQQKERPSIFESNLKQGNLMPVQHLQPPMRDHYARPSGSGIGPFTLNRSPLLPDQNKYKISVPTHPVSTNVAFEDININIWQTEKPFDSNRTQFLDQDSHSIGTTTNQPKFSSTFISTTLTSAPSTSIATTTSIPNATVRFSTPYIPIMAPTQNPTTRGTSLFSSSSSHTMPTTTPQYRPTVSLYDPSRGKPFGMAPTHSIYTVQKPQQALPQQHTKQPYHTSIANLTLNTGEVSPDSKKSQPNNTTSIRPDINGGVDNSEIFDSKESVNVHNLGSIEDISTITTAKPPVSDNFLDIYGKKANKNQVKTHYNVLPPQQQDQVYPRPPAENMEPPPAITPNYHINFGTKQNTYSTSPTSRVPAYQNVHVEEVMGMHPPPLPHKVFKIKGKPKPDIPFSTTKINDSPKAPSRIPIRPTQTTFTRGNSLVHYYPTKSFTNSTHTPIVNAGHSPDQWNRPHVVHNITADHKENVPRQRIPYKPFIRTTTARPANKTINEVEKLRPIELVPSVESIPSIKDTVDISASNRQNYSVRLPEKSKDVEIDLATRYESSTVENYGSDTDESSELDEHWDSDTFNHHLMNSPIMPSDILILGSEQSIHGDRASIQATDGFTPLPPSILSLDIPLTTSHNKPSSISKTNQYQEITRTKQMQGTITKSTMIFNTIEPTPTVQMQSNQVIPTKYITNTKTLTVTTTKTTVIRSAGITTTLTLTLTKTQTSTIIDTITTTLLKPTHITVEPVIKPTIFTAPITIEKVSGSKSSIIPNPTFSIYANHDSGKTENTLYDPSISSVPNEFVNNTKVYVTKKPQSNHNMTATDDSIFVVMTDRKKLGAININPDMVQTMSGNGKPVPSQDPAKENDEKLSDVDLDDDSFDNIRRDEDDVTKEVNHVLLGGILIASPPRSSDVSKGSSNSKKPFKPSHDSTTHTNKDEHIVVDVNDESQQSPQHDVLECQTDCKATRNEVCQSIDGTPRCVCRPGFARMFLDHACKRK